MMSLEEIIKHPKIEKELSKGFESKKRDYKRRAYTKVKRNIKIPD